MNLQDMSLLSSHRYVEISKVDMLLETVAQKNNIGFISILDLFCEKGSCLSSVKYQNDYEPFVWDSCHLTRSSSRLISEKISQALEHTVNFE